MSIFVLIFLSAKTCLNDIGRNEEPSVINDIDRNEEPSILNDIVRNVEPSMERHEEPILQRVDWNEELKKASQQGDVRLAEKCLKNCAIVEYDFYASIIIAANRSSDEMLRLLLDNTRFNDTATAAFVRASLLNQQEAINSLRSYVKPTRDILFHCAHRGNEDLFISLVEADKQSNIDYNYHLENALSYSRFKIAKFLIDRVSKVSNITIAYLLRKADLEFIRLVFDKSDFRDEDKQKKRNESQ